MKRHLGLIIVLLSMFGTPAAQAQDGADAAQKPGGTGDPLLRSSEWSQALRVGQGVKVHDDNEQAIRGKVVAVSDDQVVIATPPRWGWQKPTNRMFAKDSIRAIDAVDSPWNGIVIGLVSGAATTWLSWMACGANCSEGAVLLSTLFTFAGGGIGHAIDLRFNKRIWDRLSPTQQVTIAPVLDEHRIGLMARVRF